MTQVFKSFYLLTKSVQNVKVLKLHYISQSLSTYRQMNRTIQLCRMRKFIKSNCRYNCSTAQNCIGIPATIVCTIASSSIYKPTLLQFFCVQLQIKISGQRTTWSRWCHTLPPPTHQSVFMAQGRETFSKESNCSRKNAPPKQALNLTGESQKGC